METSLAGSAAWPGRRRLALAVAVLLVAASLAGSWAIESALGLRPRADEFSIGAWEIRNFPDKWLFEFGQLFRSSPSLEQQNSDLLRFFDLTRRIDALENSGSASAGEVEALRNQRARLENQVEAIIEHRLSVTFRSQGLTRSLPLVGHVVWPPVDMEFSDPPRSLATSPRDRIELLGTTLLRPDLPLLQVEAIEDKTEQKENVSALAFPTSGIGAYPPVVDFADDYAGVVELAAHEWTHNYLFFRPLGFNYYRNSDLRTMNETVADLVGHEVSMLVLERWPLPQPQAAQAPAPAPAVDVGAALRALRLDVDGLLAQGKVKEAEALMEQRRQELAAQGVHIRKINQAYFAFTNLYAGAAGSPGAVSPIGPKIDELRRRAGSLGRFVSLVGDVTSVAALDRSLAELGP